MIAVFTKRESDFLGMYVTPRKMFRRIRNTDDIRGVEFTGVIFINWSPVLDEKVWIAYNHLKSRQPELFK